MYRRYRFLTRDFVYSALNKLRAAFLAAKDGGDVEEIIKGVLTYDERMKVGRRIEIAQMLEKKFTYKEIAKGLKVGLNTIALVDKSMHEHPRCFELIKKREEKVEKIYAKKAYTKSGGSLQVFKKRKYTGFKRKDVNR
jgi:uncharacterized protein YerC